eukprot:10548254-Heterocapsa_arctica.AAC.1
MAKEGLGQIGQKLQTTKTVIPAVGPDARKAVKSAFKAACAEDLSVSFSAKDLGVDAALGGRRE